MVYGLDKMVYGLPWLEKTAIKWSTGDKMVYGCLRSIKRPLTLIKRPSGAIKWSTGCLGAIKWSTGDKMVYELPWLHKTSIGRHIEWSTGDKMVYGLLWLDKTSIVLDKTAVGGDKMVYGR